MASHLVIPLKVFPIILHLLLSFKFALQLLVIELPNQNPFKWEGCIYRRVDIIHDPATGDDCSLCTVSGDRKAIFKKEPKQGYRNCTEECKKPTVCTFYSYKLLNTLRPECYQCEPWNDEVVYFDLIMLHRICSEECKACARKVDLATANACAPACGGRPTFCYPPRRWFSHEMCHQTNFTYGCRYEQRQLTKKSASPVLWECTDCARSARKETAQLCAIDCEGVPTYIVPGTQSEKPKMMHCHLDTYQDVFEHDIPPQIRYHINLKRQQTAKNLTVHPHF